MLEEIDEEELLEEEDEENPPTPEMYEHHRIEADSGQNLLRVDKFLMTRLPHASRTKIQEAAETGNILVNGKVVKSSYKVKPQDIVSVVMSYPKRELEIIPENIPLNIVYEDEQLLVINKPAGMVVHPSYGHYTGTLVNALAWHLTITGHIGRNLTNRKVMACFPDGSHGKHAVTHYRVIERLSYVNVVECILETGRTHQIRAHFKYIKHPLFNDKEYGGNEILKGTTFAKYKQFVNNCFGICPRQALHAKTLGFEHPTTGERLSFDSEIPADMQQLIEKWRNYIRDREE